MKVNKNALLVTAAFGAVVGLALVSSKNDIPVDEYHCVTDQPGKYPVKILASDTGAVYREGSAKRFDVDTQAGTCSYTDKSGDTMVFHIR